METARVPVGRIFISYRHEDSAYPAAWLFEHLVQKFGPARIFKDVDSIEPGDDFIEAIEHAVGSCSVLLAMIGRGWLQAADESGRRLDDPADFVRVEIETALSRGIRVVPVLVDGAQMPRREQLPPSLSKLTARQALSLSHARFAADLDPLMRVLDKAIAADSASTTRRLTTAAPPNDKADTVAVVLARLEANGSPLVRSAYDGLVEIGYVMRPSTPRDPSGPRQSYLRFHDPARPGPAVGYLTPENISFTLDRDRVKSEPGGRVVPSTGEVAFSHAEQAGLTRGLGVARKLKYLSTPRWLGAQEK